MGTFLTFMMGEIGFDLSLISVLKRDLPEKFVFEAGDSSSSQREGGEGGEEMRPLQEESSWIITAAVAVGGTGGGGSSMKLQVRTLFTWLKNV